ncbi:MAG TPA: DNA-binding protein [Sphaerochaeta sp.]|nr:helix-turn-helix domain-containing protein [Sphaerochaeta sp.]PKL12906.1 MAG: DNA-binding protein [Spirochaetae bacterium HGW-Spirochaetae-8]PKL22448.1 MAG: DNA-binding protein [Spirochaetae bacterium HGW-Spirochaetae-4]HCG63190.1 DNA-binding protein [Sphaerochaeta sp.]HCJ94527.1 DNA-binding protein [Sphaerochaeta sp.]
MTHLLNQVLTLQECSVYLKIAESTIYVLARNGKIPCQKVGRNWRFRKEALDRWLEGEEVSSINGSK